MTFAAYGAHGGDFAIDDVIQAIWQDLLNSLGTTPLYWQLSDLNRDAPEPPYTLLLPVSEPANIGPFDSVAVFSFNVWAPLSQALTAADSLEWLSGHQIGVYGDKQNLRYSKQSRSFSREPEVLMPDNATEVWNLAGVYRCKYANFAESRVSPVIVPAPVLAAFTAGSATVLAGSNRLVGV